MTRHRAVLACGAAIWGGSLALFTATHIDGISDFAQIWVGARALLDGRNPYDAVGPGRALNWVWPLYYPLTAVLVGVPFATAPLWLANVLFAGAGSGLLAWGLSRERLNDPRLLVFLSLPFAYACILAQWSPLLAGAALAPSFGWLLACKPTLGIPLLAWRPSWARMTVAGAFGFVSLAIWREWPLAWLATISEAPHISPPVLAPFGWILLAPLVFWRFPSSWFVVTMACLPQAPLVYEAVVLFLVVRTWGESACLWLTTILGWTFVSASYADPSNPAQVLAALAPKMLWGAYIPAAAIVCRQGWQERRVDVNAPARRF